ncbi:MAG: M56 family metallopeptidase [Lachnospiraceae bacterium]|nr:M56 family metallopeptidase [Lachnospiraceae bacterium]
MDKIIEFFITSSILILFIIAIRKYFRGKVKHKFIYGLWLIVFLRFCFPLNFVSSSFSIMNGFRQLQEISTLERRENIEENKKENRTEEQLVDNIKVDEKIEKQKAKQDNIINKKSEKTESVAVKDTQTKKTSSLIWVVRSWILGVLLCFTVFIFSNLRFYQTLKSNRKSVAEYQKGKLIVYQTNKVSTPCLFGVCKPAIYIPNNIIENLSPLDIQQILEHEQMHYKHLDHIWSLLRCIIVSLYWFDPLVWLAAKMSKQDAEFACDEGVLEKKSYHARIAYGEMLLHVAMYSKRVSMLCPVTAVHNGKKEMKKRMEEIRMKKNYQKRKFLLLAFALGVGTIATFTGCGVKEKATERIIGEADAASTISAGDQTKEKTTKKTNQITVSEPVLDMTGTTGADGVRLYYADDKKLIFAGYFGLFVYDRTKEEIFRAVDLQPIECNMTQGDNACEILISEDGETVYLHCVKKDEMYVYDINENKLGKKPYDLKNIALYQGKVNDGKGTITYTSKGKKKEIALVCCFGSIGDLGYWENDEPVIPIFTKSPYKNTKVFNPEDIHDLKEAVMYIEGKEYKITNAKDLKWLEQHFANPIEEIKGKSACPFYNPIYLLREDGTSGMLYPALDDCSVYRTAEDKYYEYEKTTNDKFLKMLGWSR